LDNHCANASALLHLVKFPNHSPDSPYHVSSQTASYTTLLAHISPHTQCCDATLSEDFFVSSLHCSVCHTPHTDLTALVPSTNPRTMPFIKLLTVYGLTQYLQHKRRRPRTLYQPPKPESLIHRHILKHQLTTNFHSLHSRPTQTLHPNHHNVHRLLPRHPRTPHRPRPIRLYLCPLHASF
jgi:hypothetical protein